ncbi:DUF1835 domain-containing protein [Tenacibaculum sp. SG-28]|uniref:DUF1835 domain-containing protein n=1 Tax=Tenacibaculum sp. SG-28 TaxID=754426 RepID=UPI000CF448E2|nr:DUF1835 domain-containing protein [Tenacibaculum sp. SG-28]PQJ23123.1 DUF1835 domain-containing protein [Tenacibaculum sp. SG-28]
MSASILHITDSLKTAEAIQVLGISSPVITWREMLCEGKTTLKVGSEDFWKTRFDFFKTTYKLSKKSFIDNTLKEYRNLCKQKTQDEIVLWFTNDLYSQINNIAIISWLKSYRRGRKISIVNGTNSFDFITTIESDVPTNKELLKNYFNNRVTLSQNDIEYADYIWQIYSSDNPLRLETAYLFNPNTPLVHLENSIKIHLQRFPSLKNGLNVMENNLLHRATSDSFLTRESFLTDTIQKDTTYGFTNKQYLYKLKQLKGLFTSFHPVKLSRLGKKVLSYQVNYYANMRSDFSYLGGSKKYSFLFVEESKKLLKITS